MPEESKQTVLVVDDHEAVRKQLFWALEEKYRVLQADSRRQALQLLEAEPIDVVLCDLRMPPVESDISEGLAILEAARKLNPLLPVIVITGDEDRETALKVVQRGAYDLFHKPFKIDEVEIIVRRAANHYSLEQDNLNLRKELGKAGWQGGIVGSSPSLRRVTDQARSVAVTSATVLITGANTRRQGRFELADSGTLFLDEIGELSPGMQVKLLRVLQERQFERLGGKQQIAVDIRVIAATNRDLEQMVEANQFRQDLYYRLNVVNLELPPLRERPDDIPILATHFAAKSATKHNRATPTFTPIFVNSLLAYRWPGNIRELENVVERAVVISDSTVLDERLLPEKVISQANSVQNTPAPPAVPQLELQDGLLPPDLSFETAIQNFKRQLVRQALRECNGLRTEAAHRLKISRQYLHRLINELNVEG